MRDESLAAAALGEIWRDPAAGPGYVAGKRRTADGGHLLVQASPAQKAELVRLLLVADLGTEGERATLMVLRSELGVGLGPLLAALGQEGLGLLGRAIHTPPFPEVLAETLASIA